MKRLMFLILAAFIAWGNIAYGQENASREKKFSFGSGFSYTFPTKNDRQVLKDAPGLVVNATHPISSGISLELILGSSWHSGKDLPTNIDDTSLRIAFFSGGFKYDFIPIDRLQPFIDLGVGVYVLEAKTEASDKTSTTINENNFGFNFGAGLDVLISEDVMLVDSILVGFKLQNHCILGKESTASDLISTSLGILFKF